ICALNLQGQKLIDGIANHDINEHQNFTLTNVNGMSFFDFDEDGWDDLTYPMENDSILFYKNINGTLTQIDSYLFASGTIRQMLWVDYDNNGTLDLCISYENSEVKLYQNDGAFNFTDVSISAGIYPTVTTPYGFSFADPDQDSDLDLYICSYDPNNSQNKYFENQGDGSFIDKTTYFNLGNGAQSSFMGVWFDYNNDQNIDLHVINDRIGGNDALYENQNGTFNDIAESLGVLNTDQNPMTSSISDYNNDGFQDIFVTDFGVDSTASGLGPFRYKLFENQNGTSFIDQAAAKNVDADVFGWGALWVDYNNDSYEDLYVATGNNFGVLIPTMPLFYRNEEGNTFTPITDSIIGDVLTISFCPVKGDLNNDGFYDIAVLNEDTFPNIFLNEGNTNNYIKINPVGLISNRMAIGAQIRVSAGGITQLQTVFCGENLFAQNSQHKIFGIDSNSIIDSITILFPSGIIAKRFNVTVNQVITIYEEEYVTANFNIYPNINEFYLCPNDSIQIALSGFDNYSWSDGTTDSTLIITTPGIYYFEALNEMGDSLYRSEDIVVTFEEQPLFQELSTQVDCNEDSSGVASLVFANPSLIDSVLWSNNQNGMQIDSLSAGTYEYTVTTINNCNYSGSISVTEMDNFYVEAQVTAYSDTSFGSISIYVFGGTAPFTYLLNGDTITNYTTELNSGSYTVTVIDGNGCIQEETIIIQNLSTLGIYEENPSFSISISNREAKLFTSLSQIESIYLFSMTGAHLASLHDQDWQQNENHLEFDFPYPSGMYMVVLKTKQNIIREKVYKP
ncbi:MAG: CRTAC1 family protein, partial [Crocinitomicaceae bacterium]|nr:CRTAC1 family protein [Crocinitomicaceae bacterium]